MKISVRTSGGFIGVDSRVEVDGRNVTVTESGKMSSTRLYASEVRTLARLARVVRSLKVTPYSGTVSDGLTHVIGIHDPNNGAFTFTVRTGDNASPRSGSLSTLWRRSGTEPSRVVATTVLADHRPAMRVNSR